MKTEYETTFSEPADIGAEIVIAVAELTGEDPTDLPVLGDVIDPDAVETLFAGSDTDVRLTFEYAGYTVTVHGTGHIDISED